MDILKVVHWGEVLVLFDELVKWVVVTVHAAVCAEIDPFDMDVFWEILDVPFQPATVTWAVEIDVCDLSRMVITILS